MVTLCYVTVWQIEKKHLQIKETTSSIWQRTCCKCSQHNQKKKRAANRKKHLQIKKIFSSIWQRTRCKCSQHNQKKKHAANRSKKHLQIKKTLSSVWQRICCKCSQHNQKRNALQIKCIWLCCEHLQCVSLFVCVVSIFTICCQSDENVYLICWCFFYLHVFWSCSALSSLGHRIKVFLL